MQAWGWWAKSFLRAQGLEVFPPGGEDPSVGSSCDEVLGDSERGGGGGAGVGGAGGVCGVGLGRGVRQVA